MIIDGGDCEVGVESTIISFMGSQPALLRPGGAPLEDIEKIIGKVAMPKHTELVNQSPGRGGAHYAASAPLTQIKGLDEIDAIAESGIGGANSIGLLALSPLDVKNPGALPPSVKKIEYLSAAGDLREAACRLFAAMRRLDGAGVDAIAALPVPTEGLGLAINDRLFRAALPR
jgi:L-threonylcarbamoyladenylate synthase